MVEGDVMTGFDNGLSDMGSRREHWAQQPRGNDTVEPRDQWRRTGEGNDDGLGRCGGFGPALVRPSPSLAPPQQPSAPVTAALNEGTADERGMVQSA